MAGNKIAGKQILVVGEEDDKNTLSQFIIAPLEKAGFRVIRLTGPDQTHLLKASYGAIVFRKKADAHFDLGTEALRWIRSIDKQSGRRETPAILAASPADAFANGRDPADNFWEDQRAFNIVVSVVPGRPGQIVDLARAAVARGTESPGF